MSVNENGSYVNDGNGRLWQRFQLHDINDRIENLYANLRDVAKEFGSEPPDYSQTVNQIQQILNNHLLKVKSIANDWETKLNIKTIENNKLNDEIKKLKATLNNYSQVKVFQEGIDSYIQKRTQNMSQALQIANEEKNNAYKQLEQEREKYKASKKLIEEYKAKNDALILSIDKMRKLDKYNVEHIDSEIVAERDELQRKYNALNVKYKQKEFELDKVFSNKLNGICDAILSSKPFDAEQCRELWRKDLNELNDIYKERLKQKEIEWQRSKTEAIRTLDEEYKHLENRIQERLQLSFQECKELKSQIENNNTKHEKELYEHNNKIRNLQNKMDDMKLDYDVLLNKMDMKSNELKEKHKEMMSIQTQLSQYKILWQHFFGLDAPLRNEINECNSKLSRFERRHNIESNVAKKKRKVMVHALSEWYSTNEYPPLMVDNIPLPNDRYKRFNLFNYSKDSIKLQGFSIKNQDGIQFSLSDMEIRPNGSIVVALKEKQKNTDIKAPGNFKFDFNENEKLFLCDSKNQQIQMFPHNQSIYTSVGKWGNESPFKVTAFGNNSSIIRGFIIENITGKEITLINHYFTNKYKTFQKEIPNKRINVSETFRLITIKNDDRFAPGVKQNDIIVQSNDICDAPDDILLLCDQCQNECEVYRFENQNHNHNHNISGVVPNKSVACFVM